MILGKKNGDLEGGGNQAATGGIHPKSNRCASFKVSEPPVVLATDRNAEVYFLFFNQ